MKRVTRSRLLARVERKNYARQVETRSTSVDDVLTIHWLGETMLRTTVLATLTLFTLTACAEQSPVAPDIDALYGFTVDPSSPPPPPPVDTLAASVDDGSSSGIFDVTLFINRTETVAWLMFNGDGTTPDARLMIKGGTTMIGTGELTLGGTQLSLASASLLRSTLASCEDVATEVAVTEVTYRGGRCGNVALMIGTKTINIAVGVDRPVIVP